MWDFQNLILGAQISCWKGVAEEMKINKSQNQTLKNLFILLKNSGIFSIYIFLLYRTGIDKMQLRLWQKCVGLWLSFLEHFFYTKLRTWLKVGLPLLCSILVISIFSSPWPGIDTINIFPCSCFITVTFISWL